ncbi:Metallo-dependent phosphatase [Cristinia sonorae]|uniref:Metallo-dependent phosphatase n=1 Tax=Cristinia sonorae TaxID=1940300 RepID=A0A8K0XV42_9AGAR|nr:Metallo-dependent phosphatase [Cristinia sonorae]
MVSLPILHFNDVYRVQPFKLTPSSKGTIDVTQFAAMLNDARDQWPERPDGHRDGLVLFSGDVFSPSTESSVTRGSHMVPVMNELRPDVSMTGNHDFDFGYPHLSKLVQDTKFPWLLSNVVDTTTGRVPEPLHEFQVLERAGVRIGVIGLIEKEWIGTISSWPSNFKYRDIADVGRDLSMRLRDPVGEYRCDIIISLTHARIPNDIQFAKVLAAHSPAVQDSKSTAMTHGIDLILGGHDHLYYISKGVTSWDGYDVNEPVLGAEQDEGDVLIVKSGTDFRDLSEFVLELEDTPEGSIRNKLIKSIRGKRHCTQSGSESSERMAKLLEKLLSSVSSTLKAPICKTDVELDCRSSLVRTEESASGNWFADVLRHAYDDALCVKTGGGSDGVLICGGTIRGDSTYGPGTVTLGDILEILPFQDPIVVIEIDGETLWAALESALSTWPAQEGRFPVVSGFRVSWDSRRPAGQRVLGVWLVSEPSGSVSSTPSHSGLSTPVSTSVANLLQDASGTATPVSQKPTDIWQVAREKGGRMYKIVTREYMAEGHDGFEALKDSKYLVDDESGQMMSTLVRKYLLGYRFINSLARAKSFSEVSFLNVNSIAAIQREKARQDRWSKTRDVASKWRYTASRALRRSRAHYRDHFAVAINEHMSGVDCFDGDKARKFQPHEDEDSGSDEKTRSSGHEAGDEKDSEDDDLVLIHPTVDGRLRDNGRK